MENNRIAAIESKIKEAKKKRLIEMNYLTRMIFLGWKTYARQVSRDRKLFFKIKDFIVRRLQKKAYRSLKIFYINETIIKHLNQRRGQDKVNQFSKEWRVELSKKRVMRFKFERIAYIISLR